MFSELAEKGKKRIQIKICGLTSITDAVDCVRHGADAVGCVFFPQSPRHVTIEKAQKISQVVRGQAESVGVFVNDTYATIMETVAICGLSAVQLHGQESPELAHRLKENGIKVIKALYVDGHPSLEQAGQYNASAYLVECAKGPLPGGNAMAWDYTALGRYKAPGPLILAGGLTPDNVEKAIRLAQPDAVDVSSGVESRPGNKSMAKVLSFIHQVKQFEEEMSVNQT